MKRHVSKGQVSRFQGFKVSRIVLIYQKRQASRLQSFGDGNLLRIKIREIQAERNLETLKP